MTDAIQRRHNQFPALDGVRAIAALSIVAFHVAHNGFGTFGFTENLVLHLNSGVALFFLLSGFLLYRPFVLAGSESRRVDVHTYLTRRVFRIVPLYWTVLLVLAVWPGMSGFFDGPWLASMTFLQIYTPDWSHSGLSVAWSLCTEITFYLALPFYALCLSRVGQSSSSERRFTLEVATLAVITLASVALHAKLRAGENPDTASLAAILPSTAYLFCGGMLLAVCSVHPMQKLSKALAYIGGHRGLCWLAAGAMFIYLSFRHNGAALGPTNPLYEPIAFLLLLPVTLAPSARGRLDRVLSGRVLVSLGLISYGIYLWHDPLISHVANAMGSVGRIGDGMGVLVGTLVITILLAAASYQLVERPALLFSHRQHLLRRRVEPEPALKDGGPGKPAAPPTEA